MCSESHKLSRQLKNYDIEPAPKHFKLRMESGSMILDGKWVKLLSNYVFIIREDHSFHLRIPTYTLHNVGEIDFPSRCDLADRVP